MSRLKTLRKANKLTFKELSKKLANNGFEISPDSLAKYERGVRKPKIETLQGLANFYKVPVAYLQGNNYELKDVVKVLNNAYLADDRINEIVKEYLHFSKIDQPEKIFSLSEIKNFSERVQEYWMQHFEFLFTHKMFVQFYLQPICGENDVLIQQRMYDLIEDQVVKITETKISQHYEDIFLDQITTFEMVMKYKTRFGSKDSMIKLINNLIKNAKSFKKDLKRLPDNSTTEQPEKFLGGTYFQSKSDMYDSLFTNAISKIKQSNKKLKEMEKEQDKNSLN